MGGGTEILSAGSILNGIGTNIAAGGNPITGAMMNAAALAGSGGFGGGGGSLFGFDPSISGVGQGISEYFKTTPVFGREGILANVGQGAGTYNQVRQLMGEPQRMQPMGLNIRPGGQVAPVDYMSLLNPQQQTVIRPATPSLI